MKDKLETLKPIAVITGASRGIGAAIAHALAGKGYNLVLISRSRNDLLVTQKNLKLNDDNQSLIVDGDISKEDDVRKAIEKIIDHFGEINVLVNNAGFFLEKPFEDCTVDEIDSVIGVDIRGMMLMTLFTIPYMKNQGGGHIINMSSVAGLEGIKNEATHSSAKFAIIGFSQALQKELAGYNIKVSYICPGPVNTWGAEDSISLLLPEDIGNIVSDLIEKPNGVVINEVVVRRLSG